jgi:hypothetical protein
MSSSTPPAQKIKTRNYQHPDNLFNLLVPDNWSITQSQNSSTFTGPQGETTIIIQIINTGYKLEKESIWRFIESRESNSFASIDNFTEIERQRDEDKGLIFIKKQLWKRGVQKLGISVYQQQENGLLIIDFMANLEDYDAYQDLLDSIVESVRINPEAISNLQIYSTGNENIHKNDHFSIHVPSYWITKQTSDENSIVNTYYSPDERAIIQTLIYDDGQYLSKNVAGNLVLTILREQYTRDITISSDKVLPNGREQLFWKSVQTNYQGITSFETHGSALMAITVMWDNDFDNVYMGTLQEVINTYRYYNSNGE